jgi:hypothetical protein
MDFERASQSFGRGLYTTPLTDVNEPRLGRGGKAILIIIGLAVGLLGLVKWMDGRPREPVADRITRECEREFPTKVNECRITLMIRYGEEQQRDKLNSAYQRSR